MDPLFWDRSGREVSSDLEYRGGSDAPKQGKSLPDIEAYAKDAEDPDGADLCVSDREQPPGDSASGMVYSGHSDPGVWRYGVLAGAPLQDPEMTGKRRGHASQPSLCAHRLSLLVFFL